MSQPKKRPAAPAIERKRLLRILDAAEGIAANVNIHVEDDEITYLNAVAQCMRMLLGRPSHVETNLLRTATKIHGLHASRRLNAGPCTCSACRFVAEAEAAGAPEGIL